ncbi:LytTR family transcriptional regulator [Alkalispirillum mobile]|uniref:LytTR family transcriptional regulator n=2 Tax=Alkalispirillum mobile TaxID=85925 RepID=A0A498CBI8_9GAMM|nr:LytTR family transcriptional regulator [Alkalispirillum mobile]
MIQHHPVSRQAFRSSMQSFEHKLQQFDPGIIWLDTTNQVTAMNAVAIRILGVRPGDVLGQEVLQLHPEKSRGKIAWLLESTHEADGCPVKSPPPMTMMINIPDRVLLIKLSRMYGQDGGPTGACLVFYDLTEVTSTEVVEETAPARPRQLLKLPVYKNQRVMLLNLKEVVRLRAEGHYTEVYKNGAPYLCNLSLADLEGRLDPERFMRVHRSHMVNLDFAAALERDGDQYQLVLQDDHETRVPVSRGNAPRVRALFGLG